MRVLRALFLIMLLSAAYVLGARFGLPASVLQWIDDTFQQGVERSGELGERALADLEEEAADLRARFERDHAYEDEPISQITIAGSEVTIVPPPALIVERPAPIAVEPTNREQPATAIKLCLSRVSNAPPVDADLNIVGYTDEIDVDGVILLTAPATNSCLSSGYGPRGTSGRLHKGVDYFTKTGGDVIAAADGIIVESAYRDDYGYMVVIDHGSGVYTRYAHLKRIESQQTAGVRVSKGDVLGPIGNSGAYTDVVHLHFEILQGNYDTPRKSFGLVPVNPYGMLMP
ncbi:MAG: M23 family metallopeptidase [Pseudomonadota bacterium]